LLLMRKYLINNGRVPDFIHKKLASYYNFQNLPSIHWMLRDFIASFFMPGNGAFLLLFSLTQSG
jgi:hypothetical protein